MNIQYFLNINIANLEAIFSSISIDLINKLLPIMFPSKSSLLLPSQPFSFRETGNFFSNNSLSQYFLRTTILHFTPFKFERGSLYILCPMGFWHTKVFFILHTFLYNTHIYFLFKSTLCTIYFVKCNTII